jgi:hypothetical protein
MNRLDLEQYTVPEELLEKTLAYPHNRPAGSFLLDGTNVYEMPDDSDGFRSETDQYLMDNKLPLLKDRVPVIAYGANSNPAALVSRMAVYAQPGHESVVQAVPHLVGTVPDTAVVWHGKPSQSGGVFAELYRGDDVAGQESRVHLAYMTAEQIATLHKSEGITYRLAELNALAGSDATDGKAYAYLAGNSLVLLKDGKPVEVRRPIETQGDHAMSVEQAVNYMLEHAGETAGAESVEELVAAMSGMKLAEKKALQARISQRLGELGMNRSFTFPHAPGATIGRADFNWISDPAYGALQLAEQSLARIRPDGAALVARQQQLMLQKGLDAEAAMQQARKSLDAMTVIRNRAMAEITENNSRS